MRVHLTLKSANVKTGPIPVSTSSSETCPSSCPFNGSGCYAASGPLAIHWNEVTENRRGFEYPDFLKAIKALPSGSLWRHNQAGDLLGAGETINPEALGELVKANIGKRGFTYTHKTNNKDNHKWIKEANNWGFTVNLSANNLEHADNLYDLGAGPVVTVLPMNSAPKTLTPKGQAVITCPATYRENVTCASCKLCAISNRKTIIGFPVHGTQKKKAERVFYMVKG